jgi:membrane protein YdbS with pleckstrin-like domain
MQIYINETPPSTALLKTVRPNIHKVFVRDLIYISSIAAVIVLLLIYLDKVVGLDVFVTSFDAIGIDIQSSSVKLIIIFVFIGAAFIYLMVNYLRVMNLRYEFYSDHIKFYESVAWVALSHTEIPYKNIVKISYNYTGFMNKLLNSGEIVIDVTGMKEGSVKMEIIDQTEELVEQLLKIVKDYGALQQMQFEENRKISNIMKKF